MSAYGNIKHIQRRAAQLNDDPAFKKWLSEMVFSTTYNTEGKPLERFFHIAQ
jgi:hypothetical protein